DRSDHEMNVRKTVRIQMSSETHTAETMTYKAYIDNIKAKTGKDPEYFQALAKEKGLTKHGELLTWLKSDCGLGHGHANAIILYIQNPALAKQKIREDARKRKSQEVAGRTPREVAIFSVDSNLLAVLEPLLLFNGNRVPLGKV